MKTLVNVLDFNEVVMEKVELYYPRILEPIVPLSLTKIPPRNFYSWKENGLINLCQENNEDERKWVRFNLIEYVWVSSISIMREFGFSYDLIKLVKETLFKNFFQEIFNNSDIYYQNVRKGLKNLGEIEIENYIKEHKLAVNKALEMSKNNELREEEMTIIHEIVTSALIHNRQTSIIIFKMEQNFKIDIITNDKLDFANNVSSPYRLKPHFEIPIRNLISDFFNEPKSEKYGEMFGFYNPKEMKVFEAIRKKDYSEIIIKLDKSNELVIDIVKDGNITDEKAAAIRKILGLNEYEEISIKYRNDKNLYFRNKKRLAQ